MKAALWPLVALGACTSFELTDDRTRGVLQLHDGGQLVLGYCYADQLAAGVAEDRRRASYVHPIVGLDGEVLTEDFSADHRHHRGLSLMWPHIAVGDREVDLWTLEGVRSVFVRWLERRTLSDRATFGVENAWRLDDGRVVCQELVRYVVHRAEPLGRAIDVTYRLTARVPLRLQGQRTQNKGYGGLTLRFPGEGRRDDVVITTSAGVSKDSLRRSFDWADYSARFHGRAEKSGIAIFPHPDHPGYPAPWMLRHYGVLNVAWPGLAGTSLTPGVPLTLQYRLWVHRGDVRAGGVKEALARYRGP